MTKEEISKIIELRTYLIEVFNGLPGKNEPSALVKSQDVAHDLARCIAKIDKMLEGKVNFNTRG